LFAVDRMPRWHRRLTVGALTAIALILMNPHSADAEPGVPDPPSGLLSDRGEGDLSAADRDFVTKVRLAGLWEMPAGEMAQQKSANRRIQSIGRDIAAQHGALDKMVVEAAGKLGVTLPNQPNNDQQGWLDEMRQAQGTAFDQIYIDRLRAAHGKIFPAIAAIRASTRNDTVRKLAQRANQFVMTHMTLLESSGIVDFAALPTAPAPATAASGPPATTQALSGGRRSDARSPLIGTPVLIALLIAAVGAALFVTGRLLLPGLRPGARYRRRSASRYRGRYRYTSSSAATKAPAPPPGGQRTIAGRAAETAGRYVNLLRRAGRRT
jgi:putative membrane protein